MAKKKKRRIQTPSLSSLDKFTYQALIFFILVLCLAIPMILTARHRQSVFSDPHILAQNTYGPGFYWFYWVVLWMCSVGFLEHHFLNKQPIFGKRNIKYGPPQYKPVYPLFSRRFWKNYLANKKRILITAVAAVLLVALTAGVTALSLSAGDSLYDDGSIRVYNCLHTQTNSYDTSDVAEVRICTVRTRSSSHRRKWFIPSKHSWSIEFRLIMADGSVFTYSRGDFRPDSGDVDAALLGMLQLKALFDPGKIVLEDNNKLSEAALDMGLNEEETALLYELFDRNPSE